jgi:hypothetical protein
MVEDCGIFVFRHLLCRALLHFRGNNRLPPYPPNVVSNMYLITILLGFFSANWPSQHLSIAPWWHFSETAVVDAATQPGETASHRLFWTLTSVALGILVWELWNMVSKMRLRPTNTKYAGIWVAPASRMMRVVLIIPSHPNSQRILVLPGEGFDLYSNRFEDKFEHGTVYCNRTGSIVGSYSLETSNHPKLTLRLHDLQPLTWTLSAI